MEEEKQSRRHHHFVLVHGACHGAWCWYKVVPLLKQAGYEVTALDLGASGIHPKQVTELGSVSDYLGPLMELMASLTGEEEKFSNFSSTKTSMQCLKQIDFMDSHFSFHNGPENPPTSMLFGPKLMSTKLYQLSPPEPPELLLFPSPFPVPAITCLLLCFLRGWSLLEMRMYSVLRFPGFALAEDDTAAGDRDSAAGDRDAVAGIAAVVAGEGEDEEAGLGGEPGRDSDFISR
ncbi:unnamed protein product [Linum tenue]|uniref:AB hydrolase-1 domain-containing protein n=1 Tax=Linum tenue TaxID=586396 RepID=A0AAV0RBF7_9ROSI|nr:unnamed protein product [Linum tenue]